MQLIPNGHVGPGYKGPLICNGKVAFKCHKIPIKTDKRKRDEHMTSCLKAEKKSPMFFYGKLSMILTMIKRLIRRKTVRAFPSELTDNNHSHKFRTCPESTTNKCFLSLLIPRLWSRAPKHSN